MLSAAPVAIGQLFLSNLNDQGYQVVQFYNYTGVDQGCGINGNPGEFPVCTGVAIDDWSLTVTFTNENPGDPSPSYGLFSSPLVITSSSGDQIEPYDGSDPYIGNATTWELPLSFGNADEPPCPPCNYQITQIEFSGTIDAADTPFKLGVAPAAGGNYDGNDPSTYTIFNPQPITGSEYFDAVWTIPGSDYSGLSDPAFFADPTGFDVLVSDQAAGPANAPEPGGGLLILLAGMLFLVARHLRIGPHF